MFKFLHVGINNPDKEAAAAACADLQNIFGYTPKDIDIATFMGTEFEIMKIPFYGTKGHIGFGVENMQEAITYLKTHGIELIDESVKKDGQGNIILAYLDYELSGFAVHLKQL
ncbi:MAG: hypothetical protein LBV09_06425 [Deferribacteraceae bacterium]|jgi:2-dehydro-3-deoxyphosphogluconate aldolase/(4S)-4-hydroxy-2-oxoglutarate aldolase|nr:hypothetical protein [Deferribacteraceae bacterium]